MNHQSIDYQQIQNLPPKVIGFLKKRFRQSTSFDELRTLHLGDDLTNYGQQREKLLIPFNLDKVWEIYSSGDPAESWSGPMVNFIFSYSPQTDLLSYLGQPHSGALTEGMHFYCWLNILGPRLVIGLKLMKLDPEAKLMEIAYIEGGLYRGTQRLQMIEAGTDSTELIHHSFFKSNSSLRDLILYPFFHRMTVGEFHRKKLELLSKSLNS